MARDYAHDAPECDFYQGNNIAHGEIFMEQVVENVFVEADRHSLTVHRRSPSILLGDVAQSEARHDGELTHPPGMAACGLGWNGSHGDDIGGCRSAPWPWPWPWAGLGCRRRA
ncbi:hypothetical protein, partial [Phreatobacter sp. AB_2022a]|uniref:hypothetical protein n=1 Tax=Phreatobacter sp. AB_2022a TaxID=3003134 RepID=UPI0022874DCA